MNLRPRIVLLALFALQLHTTVLAQGYGLYETRLGDTLSAIAARYGTSVSAVRAENGLVDDTLVPGAWLRVPLGEGRGGLREAAPALPPGFRTHRIAPGDTLTSIASIIDIAAPSGTPVAAARAGTVTFAGRLGSYGNLVRLEHPGGSESWYAHNRELLVAVGERVERGRIIATVGSTGLSTGPHLHFEIRERGRPIDPLTYLR